jgi:hypothetical protein
VVPGLNRRYGAWPVRSATFPRGPSRRTATSLAPKSLLPLLRRWVHAAAAGTARSCRRAWLAPRYHQVQPASGPFARALRRRLASCSCYGTATCRGGPCRGGGIAGRCGCFARAASYCVHRLAVYDPAFVVLGCAPCAKQGRWTATPRWRRRIMISGWRLRHSLIREARHRTAGLFCR